MFNSAMTGLVVTSRSTPNTTELFGRITNPVSEPLLLNQVMCNGSEGGIIECIGGISVIPSNCSLTNNEDIGVRCSESPPGHSKELLMVYYSGC